MDYYSINPTSARTRACWKETSSQKGKRRKDPALSSSSAITLFIKDENLQESSRRCRDKLEIPFRYLAMRIRAEARKPRYGGKCGLLE